MSHNITTYIEKARHGNQAAFTTLLDIYWSEVYYFILKRTENESDAEDITIETFAKAFDKLASYNEQFAFNTWLLTIAKNVHIDLLRKRKTSEFVDLNEDEELFFQNIPDDDSIEDQLIYEQNLATLKHCIKQLKPQKTIIRLIAGLFSLF